MEGYTCRPMMSIKRKSCKTEGLIELIPTPFMKYYIVNQCIVTHEVDSEYMQ